MSCIQRGNRSGFTLIELLVVIAIIGVLIALLVPAVQKTREAAARNQCQNNLKQIGLAIHNYANVHRKFPPGATSDLPPFGTGGSWGSSWLVFILPYIEQDAIYGKYEFFARSGYQNAKNRALTDDILIQSYLCPSSTLSKKVPTGQGYQRRMQASYVAISGTVSNATVANIIPGYNETRVDSSGSGTNCCNGGGPTSGGGVFFRGSQVRVTDVKDGTSNVMMVSEHSDWITTTDGIKRQITSSGLYGWLMGTNRNDVPNAPNATNNDNRVFNCTTIRWAINRKTGWPSPATTSAQYGDCTQGVCVDVGNNIPLNSAHSGGVNILLADGSVRFLTDGTTLSIVAMLATRDDGQVLPSY